MINVRVRSLRLAVMVAVAGVALVASAMAAFAHPAPFTVTAGTAAPGTTVPVTAMSGLVTIKDTSTGVILNCASATLRGELAVGSGLTAGSIVELDQVSDPWTNCTGWAGLKFKITGFGTWHFNVDDVTGGVATGTISNFRAHMVTTAGPTCALDIGANSGSFVSSGTATIDPGTSDSDFTNATQKLGVSGPTQPLGPGAFGFWNVHGSGTRTYCISPAIWKQGDQVTITASFALTADNPANNPIAIN